MDVEVHWTSTDYPGDVIKVNSEDTVDIEFFSESNPGDTTFVMIIPLISPTASFVYSPLQPEKGQNITFDASTSTPNIGTIISYNWDFGDGEFGTGKIVTHVYATGGIYLVTLNVTNSIGRWDTESKAIAVTPLPSPPPVGGYAIPIDIGKPPLSIPKVSLAFLAAMTITIRLIRFGKKLKRRRLKIPDMAENV
jgi:PKD repeat protein